jgi:hypothetical protein
MDQITPPRAEPAMRILLLAAAWLATVSAFDPPHKQFAAAEPTFRAEDFFIGRTEGQGSIKIAFRARMPMHVQSAGRIEHDGTLVLDQIVRHGDDPPDRRQWRLKRTVDGGYSGTISDGKGPVVGEVRGNCLHLRYVMTKGSMHAEQYIYLKPDGRTAINQMTIKKLGITFAKVEEVIRKVG